MNNDSALESINSLQKTNQTPQAPDAENSLEDFASTMIHDLQAPLRSLTMFTELLANRISRRFRRKRKASISIVSLIAVRGCKLWLKIC